MKFTIARHSQSWKRTVGFVLACLAVVATWLTAVFSHPDAGADVLGFVLLAWLVGWMLGPVLTSGATVLRPEYFTLLPLNRWRLGVSLLASVFAGVGAAGMLLAGLSLAGYAVVIDAAQAIPVAVVAAVLFTITVVSLARLVYSVLGAAMRSRIGVEIASIQYGLLIAAMFVGWMAVSPVVNALPVFLTQGFGGTVAADVVAWSPGGWPLRAVDAAAAGDWGLALAWLGGLAVAAALTSVGAAAMLRPYTGNRTVRRWRRPLGSGTGRRLLPTGRRGAVVGKELRTWWRDPWRSLEIRSSIWFGIFLAVFSAVGGFAQLGALAGVGVALMIALSGANLYGYDGTALWQLVVAERPETVRADVRGRQTAIALYFGVPAVLLSAVMVVITGAYGYVVPIVALIVVVLGVGSGVSVLMSVVGATPGVEPHRRVNSNDAGENGLIIQIALWFTILASLPTLAVAAVTTFGGPGLPVWWSFLVLGVAVVNGVLGAKVLGGIAVRRLGDHLPETFARLRYPGMKVTRSGSGDWLDHLSHAAFEEARKAAEAKRKTSARKGS
ncbi:hypothetical protein GCM10023223_26530 [Stackebrandtia albiflava]